MSANFGGTTCSAALLMLSNSHVGGCLRAKQAEQSKRFAYVYAGTARRKVGLAVLRAKSILSLFDQVSV